MEESIERHRMIVDSVHVLVGAELRVNSIVDYLLGDTRFNKEPYDWFQWDLSHTTACARKFFLVADVLNMLAMRVVDTVDQPYGESDSYSKACWFKSIWIVLHNVVVAQGHIPEHLVIWCSVTWWNHSMRCFIVLWCVALWRASMLCHNVLGVQCQILWIVSLL